MAGNVACQGLLFIVRDYYIRDYCLTGTRQGLLVVSDYCLLPGTVTAGLCIAV